MANQLLQVELVKPTPRLLELANQLGARLLRLGIAARDQFANGAMYGGVLDDSNLAAWITRCRGL